MLNHRRSAALVLAALTLLAPACSSSSKSAGDSGTAAATTTTLARPAGPSAELSELTGGKGIFLAAANLLDPSSGKDSDYTESEFAVSGKAVSYKANSGLPTDGTYDLSPDGSADYKTRIVVRRPSDPAKFNGTVLVEWLNVSGGLDASPDFTYLHDEIVRKGYAWVGVSAQRIGVNGGPVAVSIPIAGDLAGKGLANLDPERYGSLNIPGDAYSYDIFTQVARALRSPGSVDGLGGLKPKHLIAVGESQSAFTLTTYANGVQPLTHEFDGFFIHSRGGAPAPLGTASQSIDIAGSLSGKPTKIRTDLKVPVMMFETESDVAGILAYAPARQPDSANIRTWEMAGTAHVDLYQLGKLVSDSFGCSQPVNNGPQHFILEAGLRVLNTWVTEGKAAAASPAQLELTADGKGYVLDANGVAKGGVRTPPVDVPVDVLTGMASTGGGIACVLAGQTVAIPADKLASLYPSRADYVKRYTAATDEAIKAGYVLPEDRDAMIAFAQPDRIAG